MEMLRQVFRFVRRSIADSAFATGMEFACMLAVQEKGTSRGSAIGYPFILLLRSDLAGLQGQDI